MNLYPNIREILVSAGLNLGPTDTLFLHMIGTFPYAKLDALEKDLLEYPGASITAHYTVLNQKATLANTPEQPIPREVRRLSTDHSAIFRELVIHLTSGWDDVPAENVALRYPELVYALAYANCRSSKITAMHLDRACRAIAVECERHCEDLEELTKMLSESPTVASEVAYILRLVVDAPRNHGAYQFVDSEVFDSEDVAMLVLLCQRYING